MEKFSISLRVRGEIFIRKMGETVLFFLKTFMQETPGKRNRTEGVTETSGGFSIYIRRRIDTKAW